VDEKFFEQSQRDSAIRAAAARTAPETHPDFDGEHCVECDTEIPAGRLALGKVRCTYCQTLKERNHAH
jgi:RNA polymerase-binding transcription factor DksA